jgi:hypothetical protein
VADGSSGEGRRLVPVDLPGLEAAPAADVAGGNATLELVPRSAAVMRLA